MARRPRIVSLRIALALTGLVSAALLGTAPGTQAAPGAAMTTTTTKMASSGTAYGAQVLVGDVAKSGPFALATLGCSTVIPRSNTNNTLLVNLTNGSNNLGSTGTTVNTVSADMVNGVQTTTADSDTQYAKILNNVITADVVHAHAVATKGAGHGEATFVNLKVLGQTVQGSPAPNTRLDLGTLGYVILNEQTFTYNRPVTTMTVTAMHVHLLSSLQVAGPVDIKIGYAQAKIDGPTPAVMEGYAYGTNATLLGGIISSGKTSYVSLPCHGTGGTPKTATVLSLMLPNLLASGTNESSVNGTITDTQTDATVTNRIQGLSLFNGRIKVDAIKTELVGTRPDGGSQTLTDNTEFLGLTIDGQAYGATPARNTKITVTGLGTIYLHRVVLLSSGMTEVRSIEVVLGANMGDLPLGTHVKIGVVGLNLHP